MFNMCHCPWLKSIAVLERFKNSFETIRIRINTIINFGIAVNIYIYKFVTLKRDLLRWFGHLLDSKARRSHQSCSSLVAPETTINRVNKSNSPDSWSEAARYFVQGRLEISERNIDESKGKAKVAKISQNLCSVVYSGPLPFRDSVYWRPCIFAG